MEHIQLQDAEMHKNSENCIVYEYLTQNSEINIGVAEITGRYPDYGYAINLNCTEMGYVIKGKGKLVTEDRCACLSEGDVVLIPKGEKYYWEGYMTVILPVAPAWHPEQHLRNLPFEEETIN